MASRSNLLKLRLAAARTLRAAERWESSYTQNRATFERLVAEDRALEQDLAEYFLDLASFRLDRLINWQEVQRRIQASSGLVPPKDDDVWKIEVEILVAAVADHIEELITIGGQAGEAIYSSPVGISRVSELVQRSARKHVAALVGSVTDTTRDLIRQAVDKGLAAGETTGEITRRVQEVIANPVRADLIARTESVNSYQLGLQAFAEESGAKSREWEARLNACVICSPLDGQVKPIGEPFETSRGPVMRPAVHPRCRCGLIYNY